MLEKQAYSGVQVRLNRRVTFDRRIEVPSPSFFFFILGRPFNRLIIRRRGFVCMRRPSLTVIKYRDRAGF